MPSFSRAIVSLGSSSAACWKALQSFLEKLLVHVGGAEIVQARGLGGIRFRLSLRRRREQAKCGQEHAGQSC